jgi:predicted alpha-1,6-mannanase (GH76 family)
VAPPAGEHAKLVSVPAPAVPAGDRAGWAARTLLRYFTARTGRWSTPTGEAWQPALAIEAMINTYQLTRDISYLDVIEKSFARYRGRRSRFYDDDGWYLNTWVRAYDVTGNPKYLDEARELFAVMTGAWDDACGGGLWWSVERTYKNAITNELFILAAARLHRRTGGVNLGGADQRNNLGGADQRNNVGGADQRDNFGGADQRDNFLDWANRAWAWFDASGMINAGNLVNDGLNGACANNGDTTWTYNQGVILSALVELWRITGDREHLRRAGSIAEATIGTLVHPDGVLREPSEAHVASRSGLARFRPATRSGNKDAELFKGIFVQGLARLYDADRAGRPELGEFLAANGDAAWHSGRDPRRGVGLIWRGPPNRVSAATHTAGCLLLGHLAMLDAGADA